MAAKKDRDIEKRIFSKANGGENNCLMYFNCAM